MRKTLAGTSLVALGLLLLGTTARAHHSFTAEFDVSKSFSVTGTITRLEWVNPHVYIHADVKDENGGVASYDFENLPPGLLRRAGVLRTMLPVGEVVTIDAYPAKDGSKHLGYVTAVHFADGHAIMLTRDAATPDKQ